MRRRSGQTGYEEKKGGWYHVRFRIDVLGQEKRAYKSVPICPVSGPSALSKLERLRKRKESSMRAKPIPRNTSTELKHSTTARRFARKLSGG